MKLILTTLIFFFCATIALAQFHIGFKTGIGLSNARWSEDIGSYQTKVLASINFGIYSKVRLTDKLSLIPELQYITKGYTYDSPTAEDFRLKINYLELPLFINYQFIKWMGVEVGPSFGLKIKAKTVSDSGTSDFYNDFVKSNDFGINGGIRITPVKDFALIIRYNHGLSVVDEFTFNQGPDPDQYIGTIKTYNKSFQFAIAYQIK